MKVTIKDIAKTAGVSYQTVSKALLGRGEVKAATAEKIRQIAKAQGYVPSLTARALTTKKSQLIAVFLPQIASSFYHHILQGIDNLASQQGYSILLYLFENTIIEDKLETILAYQVDGMIIFENHLTFDTLNRFQAHHIPLLFVNSTDMPMDASQIAIDAYDGLRLAFQHVYDLGHRRILLAYSDHEAGMKRIEAVKQLPAQFPGLSLQAKIYCDHYASAEVAQNFHLGDLRGGITAIICTSDYIALPIMTHLWQHHVRIPDDISIIGFDDLEFAAFLHPALTTIAQPKRAFGERILHTLLGLMHGEAKQNLTIFPQLLVRGSTRAYAHAAAGTGGEGLG